MEEIRNALFVGAAGERWQMYRRDGFILNGARKDFTLVSPEEGGEAGLIIVDMRAHIGPRTLIPSLAWLTWCPRTWCGASGTSS